MITRKSKFLSAMLSVCMTFSAVPAVYAAGDGAGTSDIDGHWAKTALEEFIKEGYLNGDGNGNYMPNGTMTRAQFSAIVNRILRYTDESADISKYKDVSASAWYRADLAKALAAAYLSGTSADTMSPEASITREQTFVILARILKLDTTDTSALDAYADAADVSDWAKGSVAALIKAGYVSGDDSKKINPKKALTRAEGVTVLNRSKTALDEHKVITKGVYKDGVYTGTGAGYGGTMKLQVTIKDGKISDIQILSQSETGSYLERAKTLLDKIKENNGTSGVNAVSGATRSSNGIFDAVNACLSQAEGGKDTSTTGSTGGGHGPSGSLASYSKINYDEWYLADGTYTGVASGYGGNTSIHVSVQVTGGKIVNVNIDSSAESGSYMNSAMSVIDKITAGNTTNVDKVSGATYSSNGILAAVENALDGAKILKKSEQQPLQDVADSDISVITESGTTVTASKVEDETTVGNYAVEAGASASDAVSCYNIERTGDASVRLMLPIANYSAGKDYTVYHMKDGKANSLETQVVFIDGKGYYATCIANEFSDFILIGKAKSSSDKTYEINDSKLTKGAAVTVSVEKNTAKSITTDYTVDAVPYYYEENGTKYIAKLSFDENTYKAGDKTGSSAEQFTDNTSYVETAVKAFNRQLLNILSAGSGEVDVVTGATVSATALKSQLAEAGYSWPAAAKKDVLSEKTSTSDDPTTAAPEISVISAGENKVAINSSESLKGAVIYVNGQKVKTVNDDVTLVTVEAAKDASVTVAYASGYAAAAKVGETSVEDVYVTMNVPYDDFFRAVGLNNDVKVDAVTSATENKWNSDNFTKSTYKKANEVGGSVYGVQIPVKVSSDKLADLLAVTDNAADYYCASAVSSIDGTYLEMSVGDDGRKTFNLPEDVSAEEISQDNDVTLSSDSKYGDYQIGISNVPEGTVYGVMISTDDNDYGMRHLENIWKGGKEISWSSGFKTVESHGNTLAPDHYRSINGKNIKSIKFITSTGIYSIPVGEGGIYVPVKYSADPLTVENGTVSENGGTTAVTFNDMPDGAFSSRTIQVVASDKSDVTAAYGFTLSQDGKTLSWTGNAPIGSYTVYVNDESGVYAALKASFEIQTAEMPAEYDESDIRIVKKTDADDNAYSQYISAVTTANINGTDYSLTGKHAVKIFNENGFIDLSTSPFEGMKAGDKYTVELTATGYSQKLSFEITIPEKIYTYAALSYAEYWENEGVYAESNTESSSELDSRGEYDKGGFDAVTRATTNHGLHRGSYQQIAHIYSIEDPSTPLFTVSHWSDDGKTFTTTDGTVVSWDKGSMTYTAGRDGEKTANMDHYDITGIKYVPVAVLADDYYDFCKAYDVTQNGDTMAGGYGEINLQAYTETAYVDADTNGLKTVSKSGDSWSFSARQTGSGSGILDQDALSSCDEHLTVKDYSGSYGEFLRADMLSNYGGLGAAMQTVRWDYYGENDPETSEPLASYGTKFAADNWMHKVNGIQLGLTESFRCQLPENMDGTGKWVVTIYGLGYEDYKDTIEVTSANIPAPVAAMTDEQKTQLTDLKDQAYDLLKDYINEDGTLQDGKAFPEESTIAYSALLEHYKEAVAMLANADATEPEAAELIGELPGLIAAVKPEATTSLQDAETTSETPSSVSEVLKIVEEAVNEKASENAESASSDAEKSDAPATEAAPAAAEENASAGQAEEAHDSEVSAE